MMRKAENEAVKSVGLAWAVAIVAGCFFLNGCGTFYVVQNEVHQEGAGAKSVALDAKGELDGEQNSALGLEGSLPNAGGLMDRLSPTLTKPVTVDNSTVDNSQTNPSEPAVTPEPEPVEDEVKIDEVDDVEEELAEDTE